MAKKPDLAVLLKDKTRDQLGALIHELVDRQPELLDAIELLALYDKLAEKLIELGRLDEAIQVAQENFHEPSVMTRFADKLLAQKEELASTLTGLVEAKLQAAEASLRGKKKPDYREVNNIGSYRAWLTDKYIKYGMSAKAIDFATQAFNDSPGFVTYQKLREAAGSTEGWQS